jgi:hypothetical protein
MLSVDNRRGRLIEVVAKSPLTMEDIERSNGRMVEILMALKQPGVVCGDYSGARVIPAQQIKRLSEVFARHAPRIERSGLLIAPDSDVALIQMERVINLAGNPMRRAFRDVLDIVAWLSEILDPGERVRLRMFLSAINL